ncbi:protein SODIUM POTASSIUM ROOT DEFECTIVE 1 [Rhododendron vialii]|uniref:protein SODIUM POTASSIUM ROOT DEFECTIVE 1 n=1 Tax=Rhododendron vialii TaxID=182163 RepID=UPI00265FD897|nr:protein SODIUM POTASSIUM ROOT DEFECTIVE 1 [Rhododendron vialii]
MKLRSIDIFCASQASTAIVHTTTMDLLQQPSSSSSSSAAAHLGGTRAIDRHNPIIRETTRRMINASNIPCTSHPPPLAPVPYKQLHHKPARNSSSKPNDLIKTSSKKSSGGGVDQKKKSKFDGRKSDAVEGEMVRKSTDVEGEFVRKSFGKQRGDFVINGPDSSRYLLGEAGLLDLASDFEPGFELVPAVDGSNGKAKHEKGVKTEEFSASDSKPPPPPPPPASSRSPDQEVVLRVSLHCKGCEGKVRKHISRMQGVTSFSIDFAAKKVTVVGDITPLEVLSSISKVKTAQLWSTPPTPPSLPAASSSFSEFKKSKALAVGM